MRPYSVSNGHRHRQKQDLSALKEKLRGQSRKITGPRAAILKILRKHAHPLTNREVLSEMRKQNSHCNLTTVYRSMHLLERMGIVKRFDFGDGSARYELVDDDGHHHHLVCTKCSEVIEIDQCFPREIEQQIADRNRFKGVTHKLEFFGLCPECQ